MLGLVMLAADVSSKHKKVSPDVFFTLLYPKIPCAFRRFGNLSLGHEHGHWPCEDCGDSNYLHLTFREHWIHSDMISRLPWLLVKIR